MQQTVIPARCCQCSLLHFCVRTQEVYDVMRSNVQRGADAEKQWQAAADEYKSKFPAEYEEFSQLTR